MTRLVTTPASRAAADQRAGRAGRNEPGVCLRLWSEAEHRRRRRHASPEIAEADLAPVVLDLAQWGARSPDQMAWLDPPPAAHWAQAVELLQRLGALDADGVITATGRRILSLGVHPRLGRMIVQAQTTGGVRTAAELAALLGERDVLGRDAGSDIDARLGALQPVAGARGGPAGRVRALADKLAGGRGDRADAAQLLATAFPDRVALRRPGGKARYLLSNGRGAWLPDDDPLAAADCLVAAELDGRPREARVLLAARADQAAIEEVLADSIEVEEVAEWDEGRGTIVVRRRRTLDALVLDESDGGRPDAEQVRAGLLDAVRRRGLRSLNWTTAAEQLRDRVEAMRRIEPDAWPAYDEQTLLAELESWLAPFLAGVTRWRELAGMDLLQPMVYRLGAERRQRLDKLAPATLAVPAGPRIRLDYAADSGPRLAVKLQAVFGWRETPRIVEGRVPVVLQLLDPAGRPLAVTSDLASFWRGAYMDVAKDMRGRYPKHPWPDDPLTAAATLRTKRRK
jgi:ATP-dependent helicase HrpB